MPGRMFLQTPITDLARHLGVAPGAVADEPARRNIAPGQEVVVLTRAGLARMRWGIIPVGRVYARGRPVLKTIINARGETVFEKRAFAGTGRAVVPVDGWYEWTGEVRRKTAWRIRAKDGAPLLFAAITDLWTAPGGLEVAQVATVTTEPSKEVAKIHHRMAVILAPADVETWLLAPPAEAVRLVRPYGEQLIIEAAEDVDWKGA